MAAMSETSHGIDIASPPAAVIRSASASSRSWRRATTTTVAPSRASRRPPPRRARRCSGQQNPLAVQVDWPGGGLVDKHLRCAGRAACLPARSDRSIGAADFCSRSQFRSSLTRRPGRPACFNTIVSCPARGPAAKKAKSMQQLALILTCLVLGIALRASRLLPDNAGGVLVGGDQRRTSGRGLPQFPSPDHRGAHWWLAAATPWIGVVLAVAVIVPLCRVLRWSRERTGALLLVGGWGKHLVRGTACDHRPRRPEVAGPWHRDRPVRLLPRSVHSRYRHRVDRGFDPARLAGDRQTGPHLPAVAGDSDRLRHQ